jgi:uncharacterized protein
MCKAALLAIRGYQRLLSPRKGFSCAYRVHTGRPSCSVLGYRAVRLYGVTRGAQLLRQRLHLCAVSHRRFGPVVRRSRLSQRGDCDFGCDAPCDGDCGSINLDQGGCVDNAFGALDCLNCGRESRKRKTAAEVAQEYIPPYTKFGTIRGTEVTLPRSPAC